MIDINKIFDNFLENTVNLNTDRYKRVVKADETLSKFIKNSDTFKDLYVSTTPQGSVRQKTIIKPVDDDDEFDVDLLIILEENPDWSPADYHSNMADIFNDSDRYRDITDTKGKTRCITIDYNSDFHVDLVPAIERDGQIFIFNKADNKPERTDGDGYAQWFEQQDANAGGYLVPVVRLLKYLRDSREDFETKSIILTTIAGMQVNPDDSFASIPEALASILNGMKDYLLQFEAPPSISNPAMPDEDFDRHWKNDNQGFKNFKMAIEKYADIATEAISANEDKAESLWKELFGDKFNGGKKKIVGSTITSAGIASTASRSFTPHSPYACE